MQQKPNINAVATLEKVIEIQSMWGQAEGLGVEAKNSTAHWGWGNPYSWGFLPLLDPLPAPHPQANTGAVCRGSLLA